LIKQPETGTATIFRLNQPQTQEEDDALEQSIAKDAPFGGDDWAEKMVKKFWLEQTLRAIGRPKKR